MNTRQRFLETLRYGRSDRFPYLDYRVRQDVLELWQRQGLPAGSDLSELFGMERWELVGTHGDIELDFQDMPPFEGRLRSRADWDRLQDSFDSKTSGRYPRDWACHVEEWRDRDYPLGLVVWRGVLLPLQVGGWDSLADLLYLFYDDPRLVEEMVAAVADFNLELLERALSDVSWDFAVFEEPIASNHAPVISPSHYRRLCLPHIKRIAARARAAGIDLLVADSQGAVGPLIPVWREAGLNTLWLGDVAASGLDYRELRRTFGRELRLIGGLDLRVMNSNREALERHIMDVAAPLLAEGGYIPLLDGRVRKGVPYDNYVHYRQLLAGLAEHQGAHAHDTTAARKGEV